MMNAVTKQLAAKRLVATCTIAGEEALLDQTGAMYLTGLSMLVVSDMHFEKGTSWAKRRIFLPPYDTHATLGELENAVAHYAPRAILFLGDSFHDAGGPARLDETIVSRLESLSSGRDLIWVTGNHDPQLPEHLPGMCVDEFASGRLHFTHIPVRGASGQISGHLHPVAAVKGRGRTVRRRCFATDGNRMILPSIGAYTGGLALHDKAFDGLFEQGALMAYAIGDSAIHALPAAACGR
jgi:DNA ligase-associated metallophosphoesterase